jgi:hypothetical protein
MRARRAASTISRSAGGVKVGTVLCRRGVSSASSYRRLRMRAQPVSQRARGGSRARHDSTGYRKVEAARPCGAHSSYAVR